MKYIIRAGGGFLLAWLLVACANTQATTAPGSHRTVTPGHTVHITPTTTPTAISGDPAKAILGGTLADFTARYGPLNSHSNPSKNAYDFALYGHDKNDLTLEFLHNQHTDVIILSPPPTIYWNETEARAACAKFLPSDATYQRRMTMNDPQGNPVDEQLVYTSASIASLFPASAFTDETGSQTQAGTIGLILNHWTTTSYLACAVQVGLTDK